MSPSPLSTADVDALEEAGAACASDIVLSPRHVGHAVFAALTSGQDLAAFYEQFPVTSRRRRTTARSSSTRCAARHLRRRVWRDGLAATPPTSAPSGCSAAAPHRSGPHDPVVVVPLALTTDRRRAGGTTAAVRVFAGSASASCSSRSRRCSGSSSSWPSDLRALRRAVCHARLQRRGQPRRGPRAWHRLRAAAPLLMLVATLAVFGSATRSPSEASRQPHARTHRVDHRTVVPYRFPWAWPSRSGCARRPPRAGAGAVAVGINGRDPPCAHRSSRWSSRCTGHRGLLMDRRRCYWPPPWRWRRQPQATRARRPPSAGAGPT